VRVVRHRCRSECMFYIYLDIPVANQVRMGTHICGCQCMHTCTHIGISTGAYHCVLVEDVCQVITLRTPCSCSHLFDNRCRHTYRSMCIQLGRLVGRQVCGGHMCMHIHIDSYAQGHIVVSVGVCQWVCLLNRSVCIVHIDVVCASSSASVSK
jgi:hypothetical protein